jgi:hypothetical protein
MVFSCQNNESEVLDAKAAENNTVGLGNAVNIQTELDYKLIGKLHNKGLDYLFECLKSKKSEVKLNLMEERKTFLVDNNDVINELKKNGFWQLFDRKY